MKKNIFTILLCFPLLAICQNIPASIDWEYLGGEIAVSNVETTMQIKVDYDGHIYLTTGDYTTESVTVKKLENDNWVGLGGIVTSDITSQSTMEFSPANVPYISFKDNQTLAHVMKFDGTNWVQVGNLPDYVNEIGICINSGSVPFVACCDLDYLRVKKFTGQWEQVGENVSYGISGFAIMDLGPDNLPCVAYNDAFYDNKICVKKFDGNQWNFLGMAGFAGPADVFRFKVATDGTPYVLTSSNNAVDVYKLINNVWTKIGGSISTMTPNADLAISSSGVPYVATTMISKVQYFNGNNWIEAGSLPFSGNYSIAASLDLGYYDEPIVALGFFGSSGLDVSVLHYGFPLSVEQPKDLAINFYPNPVKDFLSVETGSKISDKVSFSIINFQGNVLSEGIVKNNQIDFSTFRAGVYLLKIVSDGYCRVERIEKK